MNLIYRKILFSIDKIFMKRFRRKSVIYDIRILIKQIWSKIFIDRTFIFLKYYYGNEIGYGLILNNKYLAKCQIFFIIN